MNTQEHGDVNLTSTELVRHSMRSFVEVCKAKGQTDSLGFDCMNRGVVVESHKGRTVIDLELNAKYGNFSGNLHGAATSTIFDYYTTIAFCPYLPPWTPEGHSKNPPGGVSRALNTTFLQAAAIPTTVRVVCEVLSHGKKASYARGTLMSLDGTRVYATCEHHKVQMIPPETPQAVNAMILSCKL